MAGHAGLLGSALVRCLRAEGYSDLLVRSKADLDLRDELATTSFLVSEKPDCVLMAAGKVGGIVVNSSYPVDFVSDNLRMALNVIEGSVKAGVRKLIYFGSSCFYPRLAPQPMAESALLSGYLEPTNEPYAIAKLAGLTLCRALRRQRGVQFVTLVPCNLYGPGDNYHPVDSHVIPGLIRKLHEAKQCGASEVVLWGSGTPLREFLFSDDAAQAALAAMRQPNPPDWINVGSTDEIAIHELAALIAKVVGYRGTILWDRDRPDGTPRKCLDSSLLRSWGWRPKVALSDGLQLAYADFVGDTRGARGRFKVLDRGRHDVRAARDSSGDDKC